MNKYISLLTLLSLSLLSYSQQLRLPLGFQFRQEYLGMVQEKRIPIFTAQNNILASELSTYINTDSTYFNIKAPKNPQRSFIYRKLKKEHLIYFQTQIQEDVISIAIDPLFNFSLGKSDNGNKKIYTNTRGAIIQANLGKKLSVCSGFYENQSVFPDYYTQYIQNNVVIPGQGRIRPYKNNGFDYNRAFGYISFSPIPKLNFQFGNDKQFIGSGYRSLILSDYSFNTPYFSTRFRYKNWRFTNMILALQNTFSGDGYTEIDNRRYAGMNAVEVLIGQHIELGLYEWAIFPKRKPDNSLPKLNLFNPIPIFRSLQYGYNGKINMLMGMNALIKWFPKLNSYGQLMFDQKDRYGFQLGTQWISQYIKVLLEYNQVMPYTYTHFEQQAFVHYNLPLSHPLGANFSEWVQKTDVQYKDWVISYQVNYIKTGQHLKNNQARPGNRIREPYPNNAKAQWLDGSTETRWIHRLRLAYIINPVTDMQIFVEGQYRNINNEKNTASSFLVIGGMRTNLQNLYSDF